MKTKKPVKTVRLTNEEVCFLAGAMYHAEAHYREIVELNINQSMTKHAEEDLEALAILKKKIGAQ